MSLIDYSDSFMPSLRKAKEKKLRLADKKKPKKLFIGHLRKISLLVLNLFLNHKIVFKLIGTLNKRFNFLATVFVAYPATEKYALAYVYPRFRHWMRWKPWPAGFFIQNGKWGLMTVISSTEKDFINAGNVNNLKLLVDRTEQLRQMLNANQKTFAGVLPGIMYGKRIIREAIEADVTVEAVLKAEKEVRQILDYPKDVPLIILGGRGFIGRRLIKRLSDRKSYCVDANGFATNIKSWPLNLKGQKAILINLTWKAVISNYLDLFWPELVLLNETYPEPKKDELISISKIGSPAFHVVGLKAKSFPKFPRAYRDGIPCCAGRQSSEMEVLIYRLN